jgi:tetratricopeptide (TPR) repeat protein
MHTDPAVIILRTAGFKPDDVYRYEDIARYREHVAAAGNAVQLLEQQIRSGEPSAEDYCSLGFLYLLMDNKEDAIDCYTMALHLKDNYAGVYAMLGEYYLAERDYPAAANNLEKAIRYGHTPAHVYCSYGKALERMERPAAALEQYQAALKHYPDNIRASLLAANALIASDQIEKAEPLLLKVISLDKTNISALCMHGENIAAMEGPRAAIRYYDEVLTDNPQAPHLRANRALHELALGDWENGWQDHEARYLTHNNMTRPYTYPMWDGSSPAGKGILVYGEQGIGDEIMFASCLPDLIAEATTCAIECSPKLAGIFTTSFPTATVHASKQVVNDIAWTEKLGMIHYQTAIGSLPRRYRRKAEDFPDHNGYLRADPDRIEFWKRRLDALNGQLKIGLSWRGGTQKTSGSKRSLGLVPLLHALSGSQASFINLQYGTYRDDVTEAESRTGISITSWDDALNNYSETAALVSALDLVISVQTAIAHLGGALGKQVWAMIPFRPAWRYGYKADSMIWYPSVRLFRQAVPGDWQDVLQRIATELKQLT